MRQAPAAARRQVRTLRPAELLGCSYIALYELMSWLLRTLGSAKQPMTWGAKNNQTRADVPARRGVRAVAEKRRAAAPHRVSRDRGCDAQGGRAENRERL